MSKFTLIKSIYDDSIYGVLVASGEKVLAVSVAEHSKDWSEWANTSSKSVQEIRSSLGSTYYCDQTKPTTENYLSFLENQVDASSFASIKSLISPSGISYDGSNDGVSRRYVSVSFKSDAYPASPSSLPIDRFSPADRRNALRYKVVSKVSDNSKAQMEFQVKRVRALWDPKLGPSGGYRCPPGTEFGGYITDRFGRGCATGALRRVGASLGRAGRGIERMGENRQLRRLARVERRTLRKKPGPSRAQRASMALERGARRLVGDWQPGDGGRASRRNVPGRAPTSRVVTTQRAPRPRRVIVPQAGRPVRPQGSAPRPKPVAQRAMRKKRSWRERFALALERWANRILQGRTTPSQQNQPPRRPPVRPPSSPSPRAKKRNLSQVRRPVPNLRRPQAKRVNGPTIKPNELDPTQKTKLRTRGVIEFRDVDARWRKRLGLGPNDRVDPRDIADYIKARQDAKRSEAYLGALRADANDWDVLREFRKTGDLELLNKVGPKRRAKMVDDAGLSGAPSKRPAPKTPAAKKPAAKKAPSKRTAKKKPAAKKAPAKKTPAKKAPDKKAPAKKAPAKKAPAKKAPAKKAPAKKAPSQAKPKTKPGKKKTSTVATAKPKTTTTKPKANMRTLRAGDDYKKAKNDQDKIGRVLNDLVGRLEKSKNAQGLRRQQEIINNEVQRLNTIFRAERTSEKNRAVALAGLDALKRRKQVVDRAIDRIAQAEKQND